jgi:hypothetical protein
MLRRLIRRVRRRPSGFALMRLMENPESKRRRRGVPHLPRTMLREA